MGAGNRGASVVVIVATALFFAVAAFWTAATGLWFVSVVAGVVGVVAVVLMIRGQLRR